MNFRALLSRAAPVDPFAKRITVRGEENPNGEFVVYWMTSARRLENNLTLDYARKHADRAQVPLIVYEEPYPAPSKRIAEFARAGAEDNARDAAEFGIEYVMSPPHVDRARIVVTDEYPTRPSTLNAHLVDSNGIFPLRAFEKEMYSAKQLRDRAVRKFEEYWFRPKPPRGNRRALRTLRDIKGRGSGLSPWLHFGFLGIHEVVDAVVHGELGDDTANEFLEQAIIRRELSFNLCFYRHDYDSISALPDWARATLDKHRHDRRSPLYSFEEFERAKTHDEVWNLAQRQLLACGTMHNYLRMLWGKKIIEWSATPEDALAAMIALFNKYSLDGRDPNTYAGALWCLGKHDRPWFAERPIFGTIRYMSSESTKRKVRLADIEAEVTACEASARTRAAS